jgi:hypothetical protein
MNKQTVYIPIEITEEFWKKFDSGEIPDYEIISCSNGERLDEWVDSKEGYFFTPEELKQLLSDTFDKGQDSHISNGCSANSTDKLCYCKNESDCQYPTYPTKKEYIENLLNKEK